MQRLLDIMRQLRDPEHGCPWDIEQDFASIAPYTIEEAYEVADAIQRESHDDLRDELGDLLLQVVFHAQMAEEANLFDFDDIEKGISDKLVRRHPHVFADEKIESAEAQTAAWEAGKAKERADRGLLSLMDDVPAGLPEILRARKLQKRAAEAGFDWPGPEPVFAKLEEETQEVREAMGLSDPVAVEEEVGDLLFAAVNLARQLDVDAGRALRRANAKFEARFRAIETRAGGQAALAKLGLEEQEDLWTEVKNTEVKQHRKNHS